MYAVIVCMCRDGREARTPPTRRVYSRIECCAWPIPISIAHNIYSTGHSADGENVSNM